MLPISSGSTVSKGVSSSTGAASSVLAVTGSSNIKFVY